MFTWLGSLNPHVPLILTAPHSGETVPPEAAWLKNVDASVLLTDVDRFVDQLYRPAAEALPLPLLCTHIHRYAADLNRFPDDIDESSVKGASASPGTHSKGFHWTVTTQNVHLIKQPISMDAHSTIVARYHDRFHEELERRLKAIRSAFPGKPLYHLDCHSMPSVGTGAHSDAGKRRPDLVISDVNGTSASAIFKDLVIEAFEKESFGVSYNWPYQGGRITQRYGRPAENHHTIQVELNRALYMDEKSREQLLEFKSVSLRIMGALRHIVRGLEKL